MLLTTKALAKALDRFNSEVGHNSKASENFYKEAGLPMPNKERKTK